MYVLVLCDRCSIWKCCNVCYVKFHNRNIIWRKFSIAMPISKYHTNQAVTSVRNFQSAQYVNGPTIGTVKIPVTVKFVSRNNCTIDGAYMCCYREHFCIKNHWHWLRTKCVYLITQERAAIDTVHRNWNCLEERNIRHIVKVFDFDKHPLP